jgi:hypothetical protein
MGKEICVFKIEYELSNWSGNVMIAAYTLEEARQLLVSSLKEVPRIFTMGMVGRVDIITDSVLNDLNSRFGKDTVEDKDVLVKMYSCPYCEKEFKSNPALKAHITRFHTETTSEKE